jgi:hypothetical protein
MYQLRTAVKITQASGQTLLLPILAEVTITKSFDNQTQTAKVVLPRNIKYNNKYIYEGDDALVKRGDKIELYAGYEPGLDLLFSGYISKVNNNVPIELLCEDEMYILKQTIIKNLTFPNKEITPPYTLKKLLDIILPKDLKREQLDCEIGKIRINEASCGKVLQVLRNDYGLYSYFKDGILYVGLPFQKELAQEQVFLFERQMITDGMDLKYLKKDDIKVQIKGVIIGEDNKKTEYVYGDADGDLRTIFQYGGTKAQLDVKANSFLQQMNYTGYYGSFTTFLIPTVTFGDYAIIDSYKYPERKGTYLIKSVETSFGVNGGRQKIELERKIS